MGWIRTKAGDTIPANKVQAGKRIRIENYLDDLSGEGLTFVVSRTTYNDSTQTASLSIGIQDNLIYPAFAFTTDEEEGGGDGTRKQYKNQQMRQWYKSQGINIAGKNYGIDWWTFINKKSFF